MISVLKKFDWYLTIVISLASVLRLAYPGLGQLLWDEARLIDKAVLLARQGVWTWISAPASSAFIPWHSPWSVYAASVPFFLSPDPRGVRLWLGLLGVIAVALMYWATRRYFGVKAAFAVGLLFAAHAPAVDWSRAVINPSFSQCFIALWLVTGLLGYYDDITWAQVIHWVALSMAIQMHPANFLLTPLSLLLLLQNFWRTKTFFRKTLPFTCVGLVVATSCAIPWFIGLEQNNAPLFGGPVLTNAYDVRPSYTIANLINDFVSLTGSFQRRLNPSGFLTTGPTLFSFREGNWNLPEWVDSIFVTQSVLTAVSIAYMMFDGFRRKLFTPMLILAFTSVLPFSAYWLSSAHVQAFYLMAVIFGAVPSLGVMLARIAERGIWFNRAVWIVISVFIITQSWLTIATLRSQHLEPNVGRFASSLDTYVNVVNEWNLARQGRQTIILAEKDEGKHAPDFQMSYWYIVSSSLPARVVLLSPSQGIPVPSEGALIAGVNASDVLPQLFGVGKTSGTLNNGDPMFRWVLVPSAPDMPLDLYPENFSRFASGIKVLGLRMVQSPRAGKDWDVTLVWKIEEDHPKDTYSFSLRLVDARGERFGQIDGLSLQPQLWRRGDVVFNHFSIPVSKNYPANSKPYIQLWMYGKGPVVVMDETNHSVASSVLLTPVGVIDHVGWFQYKANGYYTALAPHPYFARLDSKIDLLGFHTPQTQIHPGQPLVVNLYWKANTQLDIDYRVFIHLRSVNDKVWGQSDKVNPADFPTTHWVLNRYVVDKHTVITASDIPAGQYQLYTGLWDEATGQRVIAYDEKGDVVGDSVPLGITITVRP